MPRAKTPNEIILMAVKATLDAFDWAGAGFPGVTIRHARKRYAAPDEVPCITIRWIKDEPRQSDQDVTYYTADETAIEMMIRLECEGEIEAEQDDELLADDPTGVGFLSSLAFTALDALKDEDGALMQNWADAVADLGRGPDEDGTSDYDRIDQTANVVYRVSTRQPSILLARGMNA